MSYDATESGVLDSDDEPTLAEIEEMREREARIVRCCLPTCNTVIPQWWDPPVCRPCGIKIAVVHMYDAERLEAVTAGRIRRRDEHRDDRRKGRTDTSVVYYLDLGPVIKIGFTSDLKLRLIQLRVDRDQVLAIEPGGRLEEAQRHAQFSNERTHPRRENFEPSSNLLSHIETVRREHGLPAWVKRPMTEKVTVRKT